MQRSNTYIMVFIMALTLTCAVVLSLTNESLKEAQAANVAFEKRQFILTTFMGRDAVDQMKKDEVNSTYDAKVKGVVVNYQGEVQEGMNPESVAIEKEYKKPVEERLLPLYIIGSGDQVDYYVIPTYGAGLWDAILGYVALKGDRNTIEGVVFDHKGETPGLGARITTDEIQSRFEGKTIHDGNEVVSVTMMKGENGGGEKSIQAFEDKPHKVDGMSGATLTGNGVNNMLKDYFTAYDNYFKKQDGSTAAK